MWALSYSALAVGNFNRDVAASFRNTVGTTFRARHDALQGDTFIDED
jgi:hypothetical protein